MIFGAVILVIGGVNSLNYIHARFCDDKYKLHYQKVMQTVLGLVVLDSDIYLFDLIITNILHNYQFCSEYKRVIGQGDRHYDNDMLLAWRPPWWYITMIVP